MKNIYKLLLVTVLLQPNFAHATSLNEALASSYQTNPDIKAAIEELHGINQEMPSALSGLLPSASASMQRGERNSKFRSGSELSGLNDTKTIEISQPLFKGGKTYSSIKKANNDVLAARASLHLVEQQILLSAAEAYMNVVRDKEVYELAQNNKSVLERHLEATKARFDLGEVTQTDVSQAKANVAKASADLISAERALESSKADYEKIIGQPANDVKMPSNPITVNGSVEELVSIAMQNNPAIKSAEYNLQAAKNEINIQKSAILPEVSAFANKQKFDGKLLSTSQNEASAVGVNVSVPLYQGGSEYAKIRQAKHSYSKSDFTLISERNKIKEEVIKAYHDYKVAQSLIESTQASVEAFTVALDGIEQETLAGLRTTIDVLDAEQDLFDAKANLIKSKRDEIVSSYTLIAQLGKLTAQELGLKVDLYNAENNYRWTKYQIIGF